MIGNDNRDVHRIYNNLQENDVDYLQILAEREEWRNNMANREFGTTETI